MTLEAGRIVEANAKICFGSTIQAFFNLFPGSQQVAQGNQAEIADEGCAQNSGTGAGSGDTGDNLDIDFRMLLGNLTHDACHAIHASVTTGNHGYGLALQGLVQSQLAAVHFLAHAGGQEFLLCKIFFNQINIHMVASDDIAGLQSIIGSFSHLLHAAGAQAHYI